MAGFALNFAGLGCKLCYSVLHRVALCGCASHIWPATAWRNLGLPEATRELPGLLVTKNAATQTLRLHDTTGATCDYPVAASGVEGPFLGNHHATTRNPKRT